MAKTAAKKGKAQVPRTAKTAAKGTAAKEAKSTSRPAKGKPGAAGKALGARGAAAESGDDEESTPRLAGEGGEAEDGDDDDMPVISKSRAGNREKLVELGKAKGYLT